MLLDLLGPASARARTLAILVLGLSPMALVTSGVVGNDALAGLASGLALTAGALLLARRWLPLFAGPLLGLLAGLALLAKFSGLMVAAGLAVTLAVAAVEAAPGERRRLMIGAVAGLLMTLSLAAPYYARNLRTYGKLFVGNWDPVTGQASEQRPGYRTSDFFLRFGGVFVHAPERARWSSFWDGLYGSLWGETYTEPRSDDPRRAASAMRLLYALAVVPSAAILFGFVGSSRRAARPQRDSRPDLLLAVTSIFSCAAVTGFVLQLPFHSTVKAFFLLGLLVPATLFAARGYERLERGLGRGRWLLDLTTAAMGALLLWLFL